MSELELEPSAKALAGPWYQETQIGQNKLPGWSVGVTIPNDLEAGAYLKLIRHEVINLEAYRAEFLPRVCSAGGYEFRIEASEWGVPG